MKKLLALLLTAAVLFTLAACSSEEPSPANPAPATTPAVETPVVEAPAEKEEEVSEEANACVAMIDAIGDVTAEKADQIAQARTAYDALSAEEKLLVGNYSVLEAAESALLQLETPRATLSVGDTAQSERWQGVLQKAGLVDAIYPSDLSGQYTYYSASEGSVFLALEFDVKNLYTEGLAFADFANNIIARYGEYQYDNYSMYYDMGTSISVTMLKGEYLGPAPLDLTRLYIVFSLPGEVATGDKPVSVDLTVAGADYTIQIR